MKKPRCSKHPDQILICPKCRASKGGKTTAIKHASQLSEWGKLGGRPRKQPAEVAALTMDEIRDFIARSPWKFAKSMPQTPHYYTLRKHSPDEEMFVRFVLHIRKHGYKRKFGKTTYIYFDVDGWQYWTMGAPVGEVGHYNPQTDTILINRAELNPAPNPQQRLY